jgi:hypothetical protein
MIKSLDFMFPKVEQEFTIQTERGGMVSLLTMILVGFLCLVEILAWMTANRSTTEHALVDTSLGRKMQVNLNITFPALACEDLHLEVMDVAGDFQLDIDNTLLTKTRLRRDGRPTGRQEPVQSNEGQQRQSEIERVLQQKIPEYYCGPCYGAQETETDCCNTCDELLQAYTKKQWRKDIILTTSEQCIREGKHKKEPKRMTIGEGCHLVGHMMINRVAGNFHIAMGEGMERNGRLIHTFQPDDTMNFNASHIIHHLSFGVPEDKSSTGSSSSSTTMLQLSSKDTTTPLNGVSKIVDHQRGTTGLFQYFIKIVPTTYVTKQGQRRETNGFFFTERFRPLMQEYYEEDWDDDSLTEDEEQEDKKTYSKEGKEVVVGPPGTHGHHHHDHHDVKKNSILPGIFFIYEIYPFAVEITENSVTVTHLLIRLMATVGGVFTTMKLLDTFVLEALTGSSSSSSR